MAGQITLDTEFGRKLKELAEDPKYQVFVEVGAWNGQGSTLCLAEGLRGRKDGAQLISFEANKNWWRVAAAFWKGQEGAPVRVLWGRLAERMMTESEIVENALYDTIKDHFNLHFKQDVEDFASAPLVHMRRCDVAILDGGEFSGYYDWKAIEPLAPRVVCLDDIRVMKNSKVLVDLMSKNWSVVWMTTERNGAAILVPPPEPERGLETVAEAPAEETA